MHAKLSNSILLSFESIWAVLFLASLLLVPVFRHYALKRGIVDVPNNRSSHQGIVPRGAGMVFVGVWIGGLILGTGLGLIRAKILALFLPAVLCMAALGYWDDVKGISARRRLLIQLCIALGFVLMLDASPVLYFWENLKISYAYLTVPFALLAIVWSTNLYNLMDDIDGLAGLEDLFVLGTGGIFFLQAEDFSIAYIAFGMCASVLGFLIWNWPRAKVFMGDVGSYTLGFLIASLALLGSLIDDIPIACWLIVYALFWWDATVTLIQRIWLKKHWATAHRDHAYQRLHQAGFKPITILCWVAGLNTLLAGLALIGRQYPDKLCPILVLVLVLLFILHVYIEKLKPISKARSEATYVGLHDGVQG